MAGGQRSRRQSCFMLMSTHAKQVELDLSIPVRVAIVVGKVGRIPPDDCRSTWVDLNFMTRRDGRRALTVASGFVPLLLAHREL